MRQRFLTLAKPFIRRTIGFLARFVRPMTLGVRVLVIDSERRVLLVRHSYLPGWYLPGGGVDAGETLAAAALRELREEAGIVAEDVHLFGVYHNVRTSRRDHVALFRAENFTPTVPAWTPNAEIREIGFFAIDHLPDDTTGATRRRIGEVLFGNEVEAYW
jgi:8-oxo-dGTP pyrophosphatase MutT (NUDIX family)